MSGDAALAFGRPTMASSSVMSFLGDDFLLHGGAARRLYHEHAATQPILDSP
jgi:hypothetical protein